MISTADAIAAGRSLLGTPYSELDCINLIKKIIRIAPGGDPKYTDAHVPALWASYNSSPKYRHLIWRQESIDGALPGHLIFKGKPLGKDGQPHHVGLVTDVGTVLHSSSALGAVVETPLDGAWSLLGQSKYIELGGENPVYIEDYGVITTPNGGAVNVRSGPGLDHAVITRVPNGTEVAILIHDVADGWDFCQIDRVQGYIFNSYITPADTPQPDPAPESEILIIDSAGNQFRPVGSFTIYPSGKID